MGQIIETHRTEGLSCPSAARPLVGHHQRRIVLARFSLSVGLIFFIGALRSDGASGSIEVSGQPVVEWSPLASLQPRIVGNTVSAYYFVNAAGNTYAISLKRDTPKIWVAAWASEPVFEEISLGVDPGWLEGRSLRLTSIAAVSNNQGEESIYVGSDFGVFALNEQQWQLEAFFLWNWAPSWVLAEGDELWWYVSSWGRLSGIHRWSSSKGFEYLLRHSSENHYGGDVIDQKSLEVLAFSHTPLNGRLGGIEVLNDSEKLILRNTSYSADRGASYQPLGFFPGRSKTIRAHQAVKVSQDLLVIDSSGELYIGAPGGDFLSLQYPGANPNSLHFIDSTRILIAGSIDGLYYTELPEEIVFPPMVSSHPADKIVPEGDTVTFAVNATGSEPLSFQWHHGQNAISGATGRTLTLADVAVPDAGSYSVVISNSAGSATSNEALMTIVIPPIVSSHPADKIVPEGDTVTFAVNATGSEPLSFQWHHGQNAISGATGRTLTLADVAVPDAGSYSVVISNSGGTALSNFAELKVSPMTGTGGLFSATEKFGDDWEFVSWFGFFITPPI